MILGELIFWARHITFVINDNYSHHTLMALNSLEQFLDFRLKETKRAISYEGRESKQAIKVR